MPPLITSTRPGPPLSLAQLIRRTPARSFWLRFHNRWGAPVPLTRFDLTSRSRYLQQSQTFSRSEAQDLQGCLGEANFNLGEDKIIDTGGDGFQGDVIIRGDPDNDRGGGMGWGHGEGWVSHFSLHCDFQPICSSIIVIFIRFVAVAL
jgi:hypothetical protein